MKLWVFITLAVLGISCVESEAAGPGSGSSERECIDHDEDGYGVGCPKGRDCDDEDPSIHDGCLRCVTPQADCGCDEGSLPVSCFLEPTTEDDGTTMCHEGTRYCREGVWSGCESIFSYPRPGGDTTQGIIDPDAGPEHCNNCQINCFVVRDNLDPVDGGVIAAGAGTDVVFGEGGGITLAPLPDGGAPDTPATYDPSQCVLNTAPDHDCDGIPDEYDPYPYDKPFATANPTIFIDIAPGQSQRGVVNVQFFLNLADVYFLVDQSGSMEGERDQLKADLTTGDFIQDPNYTCSDFDFDRVPNNEQKDKGIIGAIRCIIRDAHFGIGLFREIPFSSSYAPNNQVVFSNYQDITEDVTAVIAGVNQLTTVGNNDWPEASMLALNTVVTGNGMYFGTTKPGIPSRTTCPADTWGYPCFRNGAIPIVIMFTDAQFHNGPPNNAYPYSASALNITKGTTSDYTIVPETNEIWESAYDLGDLTNAYISFSGSTSNMVSDLNRSAVTCISSSSTASPDALFKFSLSSPKTVTLNTEGSLFDTTVSLFLSPPTDATVLASYPNTNDTAATAYGFGAIDSKYLLASGNSSGLAADYSGNDVSCNAHPDARDAVFSFTLDQVGRVAIDTAGSSYNTVVGLFSGVPAALPDHTAIANTNDKFESAYDLGPMNGQLKGVSGSTSPASITADFSTSQVGCSANSASPDAVHTFTLSSPTRVRLSTEGSTLPTVLALTGDASGFLATTAIANTNDTEATAYDIGVLDGQAFRYTGSTSSLAANYPKAIVGCNAHDSSRDAVYKFTLDSQRTVEITTVGSNFDTVLSLFTDGVGLTETSVTLPSNTNETGSTAYDLGVVNSKHYGVTGGSTNSMISHYTGAQIGCSANDSARDAVYAFSLSSPTRVQLDTIGSSFDTVLSLHSGLPDAVVTTLGSNTNEAAASAYVIDSVSSAHQRFDGNTNDMTADVIIDDGAGCSANTSARDAVYQFTVATSGSYEISTEGSSFDTVLGLFPSTIYAPTPPAPTDMGSQGETKASAVDVGSMDNEWLSFTGSTQNMADDNNFTGCSANASARDAYYKFTLSSQRTITIDTIGSSFDTVIGLFNHSNDNQIACDNDSGGGTSSKLTATLNSGTYYVIISGRTSSARGAYKISFRDSAFDTNLLECNDNGAPSSTSKITRNLSAGATYYAVVKGSGANHRGAYSLSIKDVSWFNAANRIACDDNSGGSSTSRIQQDLPAGSYHAVIKGRSSTARGNYKFSVQDLTTPPESRFVTCNDDHGSVNTSRIEQTLDPGTYHVVVKGYQSSSSGSYVLNIRDTVFTPASVIQCDASSGAGGSSLIERDLTQGTYNVIVKGRAASDQGAYKLQLRDLTQIPTNRLACDRNSGTGGKSYLEYNLSPGTYTAVLTGNAANASGAYNLSVRDALHVANTPAALACDRNSGNSSFQTSKLSYALPAGTFYAAIKGYSTAAKGSYQFNVGAASTTTAKYVPPTWSETLAAVQAENVRVMTVLSCRDDPSYGDAKGDCITTRNQAIALANATDALGSNLEPLVFDIDGDGSGLSSTVIKGVASLARYLEMNVRVRVVFEPDPNPGFELVISAIDVAGDGCDGLIGTEHQKCVPGATPRFELEFTNPLNAPVPINPNDPNGGYNFRAELIGDNQFIVDQIPIYIIPENVRLVPPPPKFESEGYYTQDVSSKGCKGTTRPDWHDLSWNVNLPEGTSVEFAVCTGNSPAELDACTSYSTVATITGGPACSSDAQCELGGRCSPAGSCHTITAPGECQADSQCPSAASCIESRCIFPGQPVYIGDTLAEEGNYKALLRMKIGLKANMSATEAPTIHDWSLTYFCDSKI